MAWSDLTWTSGDRLRKAYEAAGFDGAAGLAREVGTVTRQTIGRWQAAKHAPRDANFGAVVDAIAPRLGVKADELARWIESGELPAYTFRYGG